MTMPFTTTFLTDIRTVSITYEGEMERAEGEAAIAATGELVAEHGSHRFLADCSSMQVSGSLIDVLAFVERLSSMGMEAIEKEAIVLPRDEDAADRITFFETACRNRGLNVRLFSERDEALAWLAE
jgi:hypothetical protein